ncbi:neprilysin-1-like [Ornithodoros turicata]|uniref:neprilysin-1-like n=1 Tax=Ornithodoros turicata TaxID=34597 RepID=UPI003139B923
MNEDQGNGDEARSSSKAAEEPEGNILISGCIVLTCLVTIVSLVSLLYYIEDSAGKIKRHATTRTCLTTDCYQMTQQLHFATTEVYPCADFLSHVCGTWAKSAGVDSTLASAVEDAFLAELEQKLRVYSADRKKQDITEMTAILYQSCLAMGDSHPSDKLKKVLENFRLKNWPNFDYTDSADFDVFAEILKADLMWNMNIVFKGERIYRFDIGKPRVSFLPIVLVCPYRGNNASLEQGYAAYVEEIFRIFGYQSAIGTHEVASLHLELCKLSRAHLENDYQYFESILNLTAAHGITRKKWMQHIKPLGKLTDKSILYTNLYFVSSALELLTQNSTTVQVMRYMGYMIANQFAATDSRVQAARDNHPFLILSPPRLKRTMPTPCMHEVTVHFLNAFNMFSLIASNPNRTTNEDIVRLIHTIMAATHERVRASTWMDEDSKARTLKKLKKATVVGPVAAMYAIALNVYERYENLHDLTDDYYDNLLKIKQNDATFQLSGRKRSSEHTLLRGKSSFARQVRWYRHVDC